MNSKEIATGLYAKFYSYLYHRKIPLMQDLNLPIYPINVKTENGKTLILDVIRKKYVIITPEEWVRQHFVHFLISEKKVPATLIAVEKSLRLNRLGKRTDIVVYDKKLQPLLIVECKSPEVKISQETFDQIARYNMTINAHYLIVTNGLQHFTCFIDHEKQAYTFLPAIPAYDELKKH